jgi:hypothetical protein
MKGCERFTFETNPSQERHVKEDGRVLDHRRDGLPAPAVTGPAGLRPSWSRSDWTALADRMLSAVRPYASPGHARISLPGVEGGYGHAIDGLEGFARTFLLAGFRIAGERGQGLDDLIDFYVQGIAAGVDPASPDRWVRLDEHPQAKVEAASIALILDMTRPWIWDRLTPAVQDRVVDYLLPAVGDDTYPRINWVWFRLVVQTFLRSVGGPHSLDDMAADLATHDTFTRADGWLSDGASRAYDHYVGWALHLYPTLWARMAGAADLAAPRREHDAATLDRFLTDAIALVGADGSPLIQGRSLIYRFSAAAPFWVGALAGVPSLPPGRLRRAASLITGHFVEHGAPDDDGLLTMGWHQPWRRLAQSYSGPGSPYWATKGMLGLALPADHPVWTAAEEPLPSETTGVVRAMRAPGWIAVSTPSDGIVRVVNHGTDHAVEGSTIADSPLYARIGYSTATSPALDEEGWNNPVDQSVTLVDPAGRATHRTGMRTHAVRVDGDGPQQVGVAGSTADVHWVDVEPGHPDHGEGRKGPATPAGRVTVYSLVRGPWELRLSRLDALAPAIAADQVRLRVGGWPIAGDPHAAVAGADVTVTGDRLRSRLTALSPDTTAGVAEHADASPLGPKLKTPWLQHPARIGTWVIALVELAAAGSPPARPATASVHTDGQGRLTIRATWPDELHTSTQITEDEATTPVAEQQHTGPDAGPLPLNGE